MKTSNLSNISFGFVALGSVLLFTSCAQQKEKEQVKPEYKYEIPASSHTESTEMADLMKSKGMTVVKGETSMEILGEYEIKDARLVAVSGQDEIQVTEGVPFQDYRFKFTRGNNNEMVISYASEDGTEQGISVDSKLDAVGDIFTVSAQMKGVIKENNVRFHLIITGKKGETKGWEYAIIMKGKAKGNISEQIIREGSFRIFKGNGAEKAITTPSAERRAFGHQIFRKSIFDIR